MPRPGPLEPFTLLRHKAFSFPLRTPRGDGRHRHPIATQRQPVIARFQAAFENDFRPRRLRFEPVLPAGDLILLDRIEIGREALAPEEPR